MLWLVPTHALGSDALASFTALGIRAAVWKGRDYIDPKDPDGKRMCLDIAAVNEAVAIGLDIEKYICGNPETEQVCPYHSECKFQAQKAAAKRAEVIIAAHQSLFGTLAKILTENVGLAVVDESWWKAGLNTAREIRIGGFNDGMTPFPAAPRRKRFLRKIQPTEGYAKEHGAGR